MILLNHLKNLLDMDIDSLIEQLIQLKSDGVKNIAFVDSYWNDFDLDSLEKEPDSDLAFIIINPIL